MTDPTTHAQDPNDPRLLPDSSRHEDSELCAVLRMHHHEDVRRAADRIDAMHEALEVFRILGLELAAEVKRLRSSEEVLQPTASVPPPPDYMPQQCWNCSLIGTHFLGCDVRASTPWIEQNCDSSWVDVTGREFTMPPRVNDYGPCPGWSSRVPER